MRKIVASLFTAALIAVPPAALAHHGRGSHAPGGNPGNSSQQQQQQQEQEQSQEQSQCIVVIGLLQPAEC